MWDQAYCNNFMMNSAFETVRRNRSDTVSLVYKTIMNEWFCRNDQKLINDMQRLTY